MEKSTGKYKIIKWFVKWGIASILAFGIISIVCSFYYNPPIHIPCTDGVTDYKREENAFWSRSTEGFAHGKTDTDGYNNSEVRPQIDMLLMGSSQTEGLYVDGNENVSYVLNETCEENDKDFYAYNIGMSSHMFTRNVSNLPAALQKYDPKYVAIEVDRVNIAEVDWESIKKNSFSELKGFEQNEWKYYIQKNPYIKLSYLQLKNYMQKDIVDVQIYEGDCDTESLDAILDYVNEVAKEYDCKVILYYLPTLYLDEQGNVISNTSEELLDTFSGRCDAYGVKFVDMTAPYFSLYETEKKLPTGFSNTTVGYGHINRDGHRLLAEALYEVIEGE